MAGLRCFACRKPLRLFGRGWCSEMGKRGKRGARDEKELDRRTAIYQAYKAALEIDLEIFGKLCGSPGYATTTHGFPSITSCGAPLLTQRSGVRLKLLYPVLLLIYRKRGHECIYFRGQLFQNLIRFVCQFHCHISITLFR